MRALSLAILVVISTRSDINVDIPSVSNALSRLLLKLSEMIHEAEMNSRTRGQALVAAMKEHAPKAGIALTTSEIAAPPAEFGNVAAANARYYDLSLIGWEPGNQARRMTAEGLVFESGRLSSSFRIQFRSASSTMSS
ncbi:hypothetical protein [Mesorhizobium sp. B2-3-15]|uniref:hypothetical protein n=1 Tax=Mesorhizobium sp. B2-3-15 TaxID=2589949 RepID=UPI001FEFA772|nr:hypothetical protein [Mesorhizobium sp. B2-3-15]